VEAEVAHLFFELVSGGRASVRGVSLWFSQDPAPKVVAEAVPAPVTTVIPAVAPVANAPAAAPRIAKAAAPVAAAVKFSTIAAPSATAGKADTELMQAVQKAFAGKPAGKVDAATVKAACGCGSSRRRLGKTGACECCEGCCQASGCQSPGSAGCGRSEGSSQRCRPSLEGSRS
jgi:hypothetical protein